MSWGAVIVGGAALIGGAISKRGSDKSAAAVKQAEQTSINESRRQFDLVREDTAPVRALGNAAVDRLARLYGYGPMTGATPGTGIIVPQSAQLSPSESLARRFAGGAFDPRGSGFQNGLTFDNDTGQPVDQPVAPMAPGGTGTPDMTAFFESPDYQFNLAEGQKAIDRSAAARGGLLSGAAVKEGTRYASGLATREYSSFVDRLMQQAGLGTTGIGASASAGANSAATISQAAQNSGNARASIYGNNAANINNAVQGAAGNVLLMRYLGTGGGGGYPNGGYGGTGRSSGGP